MYNYNFWLDLKHSTKSFSHSLILSFAVNFETETMLKMMYIFWNFTSFCSVLHPQVVLSFSATVVFSAGLNREIVNDESMTSRGERSNSIHNVYMNIRLLLPFRCVGDRFRARRIYYMVHGLHSLNVYSQNGSITFPGLMKLYALCVPSAPKCEQRYD